MNGFALVSDSQRKAAESGMISREEADKKCRVYDFLAACDKEDLYILFDSSAFNEIAKAYLRQAVEELTAEGKITEEQGRSVRNRVSVLFDESPSKPICES